MVNAHHVCGSQDVLVASVVYCTCFQSGKVRRGKRWVGYYTPGGGQQHVSTLSFSISIVMVTACCGPLNLHCLSANIV